MPYIYKITNTLNQKSYIGKTSLLDPNQRWKEHQRESKKERSQSRAIYRAMKKYGIDNFTFSILEETDIPEQREQDYIIKYDTYHNGYNETLGGDGGAYLELPEEEICKYYLSHLSLKETYEFFGHDKRTIKKILYKYNIPIYSSGEVIREKTKKAVAQIDLKTNQILHIYPSIQDAERAIPCNKHISAVCQGKRKSAGGFKWNFV